MVKDNVQQRIRKLVDVGSRSEPECVFLDAVGVENVQLDADIDGQAIEGVF